MSATEGRESAALSATISVLDFTFRHYCHVWLFSVATGAVVRMLRKANEEESKERHMKKKAKKGKKVRVVK